MSRKDARFFIENDPGTAVKMFYTSLRCGSDHWKDMMQEGIIQAINSQTGERRDLLDRLMHVKKREDGLTVLNAILDGLKPKSRLSLFSNVRGGSIIVMDWFHTFQSWKSDKKIYEMKEGSKEVLAPFLDALEAHGIPLNPEFKGVGNRGKSYDTSLMFELFNQNSTNEIQDIVSMPGLELLFERGLRLDRVTRAQILGSKTPATLKATVQWFESRGHATLSDFIEAADHPRASSDSVALLQAEMARRAIDALPIDVSAKKKAAP
jgi:hypothetical protein